MPNKEQDADLLRPATKTIGYQDERTRLANRRTGTGTRRFILTFIALLFGVGAGLTLFYFPVLAVSQVTVVGAQRSAVQTTVDSLALQGTSLLSLPVEDIRARLRTDPWVRNVAVHRSLPSSLVVYVEERERTLQWQVGQYIYWVDRDGTVLEPTPKADPTKQLVKDMDGSSKSIGEAVDPDAVKLTLALSERVPLEIREKPVAFEYLSYGGIVVETDKAHRARFGDSTDLDWKLATWAAVLKSAAPRDKVGHIDLRFNDRPFYRP